MTMRPLFIDTTTGWTSTLQDLVFVGIKVGNCGMIGSHIFGSSAIHLISVFVSAISIFSQPNVVVELPKNGGHPVKLMYFTQMFFSFSRDLRAGKAPREGHRQPVPRGV